MKGGRKMKRFAITLVAMLTVVMAILPPAEALVWKDPAASAVYTYHVTVNYGLSLTEMIRAGRYDWVDPNITSDNFPINGKGTKEVALELVHFNRYINSSEEVIRELGKKGLRPATIVELLAFSAKYTDVMRQSTIAALGSVWLSLDGRRRVPSIWGGRGLGLGLDSFESGWNGEYRFLAVRK